MDQSTLSPSTASDSSSQQGISFYPYAPSLWLPLLFSCLYCTGCMLHIFQIGSTDHRYMLIVFFGCLACGAANGARVYSHYRPDDPMAGIAQEIILVMAPSLFALTLYLLLSRILDLFGREVVIFRSRPKSILAVMVALELLGLTIQGIAMGLTDSAVLRNDTSGTYGSDSLLSPPPPPPQGAAAANGVIVLVALAIQLTAYLAFLMVLLIFSLLTTKARASQSVKRNLYCIDRLRILSLCLALGILLLSLRCIFRMVQTSMGPQGLLQRTEWYFYLFDQTPSLLSVFLLNAVHPGHTLPAKHSEAVAAERRRRGESLNSPAVGDDGGDRKEGKGGRRGGLSYRTASSFYCAEARRRSLLPHSWTFVSPIGAENRKISEEGINQQQIGHRHDSGSGSATASMRAERPDGRGVREVAVGGEWESSVGKHDVLYPYEQQDTQFFIQSAAERRSSKQMSAPAHGGHPMVDAVYDNSMSPNIDYGHESSWVRRPALDVELTQAEGHIHDGFGGFTLLATRPDLDDRAGTDGRSKRDRGGNWSMAASPSYMYGSAITRSWIATQEQGTTLTG